MKVSPEKITSGLKTKSDKIRALAKAGYLRTDISKLLGILISTFGSSNGRKNHRWIAKARRV
jgi:hypothetical protein